MRALKIKSKTQTNVTLDARQVTYGDVEITIGPSGTVGGSMIIYLNPDQAARLRDWLEGAPCRKSRSKVCLSSPLGRSP